MERGISFEIPNKYGNYIGEILKPVELSAFSWYIGGEESYLVENGTLGEPLFPDEVYGMDGRFLKGVVENNNYYVIFASLKAFPKERDVVDVRTYEQFLNSECQLVLLVIDCAYVTIYCKDKGTLKSLYDNSKTKGFVNVQYITDENDFRTRLSVW